MEKITVDELVDNPTVNKLQDAAEEVLRKQKVSQRRKNSYFSIAQGVLQLGNITALALIGYNWVYTLILALVLIVAETVAHAFTPGPLTPSAAKAVEEELVRQETAPAETPFSVYHKI